VKQIRTQIEDTTSDYDREKLQERLAKLVGGVAVIKVGAATETEMKEKKARVEDAMHATKAAVEEGIVPGGGVALLRAGKSLDSLKLEGDQRIGLNIIARAIEHKGAALVDVLQTCPTYNDLYTKEWYEGADLPEKRSRLYKLEEQGFDGKVKDPADAQEIIAKKAAAVARSYEAEPIPIGVYYEIDLPTYEDEVFRRIPGLKETPLVEQNSFERDVNPLLEAMR